MWSVVIQRRNGEADGFNLGSGEAHQLFEMLIVTLDTDKVHYIQLVNPKGVVMNEVVL